MNERRGLEYHQRVQSDLSQGFALDESSPVHLVFYQPAIASLGAGRERLTLPATRGQLARPVCILCILPFLCRNRGSLGHLVIHKCKVSVGIHLRVLLEARLLSSTASNPE